MSNCQLVVIVGLVECGRSMILIHNFTGIPTGRIRLKLNGRSDHEQTILGRDVQLVRNDIIKGRSGATHVQNKRSSSRAMRKEGGNWRRQRRRV